MIDFKGFILAACLVAALGLSTKRQFASTDGVLCSLICQNRPEIVGRTAKCLVRSGKEVHSIIVRNPGYGDWQFYTVDSTDIEEDKLCKEVIAGDEFFHNHTETVCPSSVQYAKAHDTVGKGARSYRADTTYRNDKEKMRAFVEKMDEAVNRVLQNPDVTTKRFAQKRANALARQVVETMNRLKKEVGLLDFGRSANYMTKRQDSKDNCTSTRSDAATELVGGLVNMVRNLAEVVENNNTTQTKRANGSYSSNNKKDEYSGNYKRGDVPTPPPVIIYRGDDSLKHKKRGLSDTPPPTLPPYNRNGGYNRQDDTEMKYKKRGMSYVAPPTSPPYYPNGYSKRGDTEMKYKKRGMSYVAPPTFPPYNRNAGYNRQEDTDMRYNKRGMSYIPPPTSPPYNPDGGYHRQDDTDMRYNKRGMSYVPPPTSPPYNPEGGYNRQEDAQTRYEKKGSFYIAPPTFPPINPDGHEVRGEDYDEQNDWPTLPSANKREEYDSSNYNRKDEVQPTLPPYYPSYYRQEHAPEDYEEDDRSTYRLSVRKRNEMNYPAESSRKKRNNENDNMGELRGVLEKFDSEYKRSDSKDLGDIVRNLREEVTQIINTKKRADTEPENAYLPLLTSMVDAVAKSIDSVLRNSQTYDDVKRSLRATYHPVNLDTMDSLCGLMTTEICDKTKVVHCKEDYTCCWAYVNDSTCNSEYKDCYSILSNILDKLMT